MSDRAHTIAITARKNFLADQGKERQRLNAEFSEAEAAYHEWLAPKIRFEKVQNERRVFESDSRIRNADLEQAIRDTADPRIAAAIRSLANESEQVSALFSRINDNGKSGRRANTVSIDARIKAIKTATDELAALIFSESKDVAGDIQRILAKIPPVLELV